MSDPEALALELYARGFTDTREAGRAMVAKQPDVVAFLLDRPEMRNPGDIAHPDEWGGADTGQP